MLNLRKELEAFGKLVVTRSRYNLTRGKHRSSGELYRNINYDVSKEIDGYSVIFTMPEYGEFLDKGVSGVEKKYKTPYKYTSRKPPYKSIFNWVKTKKIRFRDSKGQFAAGNYKTIAAILRNSIYKKGIKPTLFFTKPFEKHYTNLPDDIVKAFGKDIDL